MIFVTVGSQMPFDRLVTAVDTWAAENGVDDVVAQIGDSEIRPAAVEYFERVPPSRFDELCASADLIVSHAGMGSILTALRHGTPIVVMPRRAVLRETRNDHQVATAVALAAEGRVHVAMDESELAGVLASAASMTAAPLISDAASAELIATVGSFLERPVPRWRAFFGR